MLANAVKAEVDDAAIPDFSDVSAGPWYTGYVAWGHKAGLMAGNENNEFWPLEPMAEVEINEVLARNEQAVYTGAVRFFSPRWDCHSW